MISFEQLEKQRSHWEPQIIKPESTRLEGNNLDAFIQKSIALGLLLEVSVAEWVIECRKQLKNKDVPENALTTLYKNIKDEGIHAKAFHYAAVSYGVDPEHTKTASEIADKWNLLSESIHPLWVAAMAETGVFLTNLAVLRLAGGHGLADMAGEIARDEYRHVGTNRAILQHLGYQLHNPPAKLDHLREETVNWLFEDLEIPELDIDDQWLMDQSDELTYTGNAPELSEISAHFQYNPPFERSNSRMY